MRQPKNRFQELKLKTQLVTAKGLPAWNVERVTQYQILTNTVPANVPSRQAVKNYEMKAAVLHNNELHEPI